MFFVIWHQLQKLRCDFVVFHVVKSKYLIDFRPILIIYSNRVWQYVYLEILFLIHLNKQNSHSFWYHTSNLTRIDVKKTISKYGFEEFEEKIVCKISIRFFTQHSTNALFWITHIFIFKYIVRHYFSLDAQVRSSAEVQI